MFAGDRDRLVKSLFRFCPVSVPASTGSIPREGFEGGGIIGGMARARGRGRRGYESDGGWLVLGMSDPGKAWADGFDELAAEVATWAAARMTADGIIVDEDEGAAYVPAEVIDWSGFVVLPDADPRAAPAGGRFIPPGLLSSG